MNQSYFNVENASKSFKDKEIFHSIEFSLKEGEILSLVGPSGTGKSTLLRCISGLEEFSAGSARIQGRMLAKKKTGQRSIGMVFQQPLLFPHLTILENVIYGLRLFQNTRSAQIEGLKYLKSVGLEDFKDAYPHALSGGQQQRVALIRALIVKPKLLLLDEPFSNLDPDLRRELREWVRKLLKKENMTAIFVTHDREEAMLVGDRVAVLAEGSIQQIGLPHHVYEKPKNPLVARYYSDALIVDEQHFVLTHHLNWVKEKTLVNEKDVFMEAEWVNETYQYGQRYAHVKLVKTKRRYVMPIAKDLPKVKEGEDGFVFAERSVIRRFSDKEEFDE